MGLNPSVWFGNVEVAAARVIGRETVQYVSNILKYYLAYKQINEAEQRRRETELSPEAFAVYWMLKREGVAQAQQVADSTASAFDDHPHWQTSSHQEQEVRKSLYKGLIDAGVEGVVEVAQGIMKMLRRASS